MTPPTTGKARWLALAAAPTFALMALATAAGPAPAICGMAGPLSGMTAMYLLMALFHLPPWLALASPRRNPRQTPG